MPASSGGDGYRDDGRSPIRTLRERAGAVGKGARVEPRSLDEILPERGEAARSRDMQATWQAFCLERYDMVLGVLESRRAPPEIAYQLGELVHTYFRPRGLTLTSQELRRLVAELLDPTRRAGASRPASEPQNPPQAEKPATTVPSAVASQPKDKSKNEDKAPPSSLVAFRAPSTAGPSSWTGDEPPMAAPTVSEATFEPPASPLVGIASRAELGFDRLLARTLDLAKPRLATSEGPVGRDEALRALDAALDEVARVERVAPPSAEMRQRVVLVALSEICGLGLIDRLWADRTVRAVFINGPKSVFVEREGGVAPAAEVFRDQAHLLELVSRLAEKPASGVADIQLRDGGTGTVVFPPAAPDGPVLTIRRAEPGSATLSRLIAADVLDQKVAALLRVAVRTHLKVLIMGEAGSGKTALLAALGRDLDPSTRIVTLARHREFRWSAAAKVELVATPENSYAALLGAAESLRPQFLIVDSPARPEADRLAALVARAAHGVLAAFEPAVPTAEFVRSADLMVRLNRGRDGLFRVVSLEDAAGAAVFVHEDGRFQCRLREPAFAERTRAAGYGEALAAVLR